jgi:hypothetical protein
MSVITDVFDQIDVLAEKLVGNPRQFAAEFVMLNERLRQQAISHHKLLCAFYAHIGVPMVAETERELLADFDKQAEWRRANFGKSP